MSSIRADIQLNAAPFLAGIARVQSSMRNLQAVAAGITGAFFAVRSVMAGLSAVFDGMKGALDMGGKFSDLSASTGASVSELVLLTKAFENNGLAADAVGPMIARFQKALGGLNEEGQSTTSVLEKLGINTLALGRMSVAAQFQELSRAFSAIEDPALRTRRAMELFGRSGAQMLTLFRDPEAFSRAAAEIGSMGDVLEDNATKFDSMSDAITTIGQKMDQFFVGAMSALQQSNALEDAAKTDFTPTGQSAGAAAASILNLSQAATDYIALLPGIKMMKDMFLDTFINPKIAEAAAGAVDRETESSVGRFDPAVRSVASEEERASLLEEMGAAADATRERIANLYTEFADVPEGDRMKIYDAMVRQVEMIEAQKNILSKITPEVMAANAAEAERAAALAKSAAAAAKLAAELDRTLQTRDAETEKRIINELPPEQAQQRVLEQVETKGKQGVVVNTLTPEGVTAEIERLRALGGEAADAQKARLVELIEAEKVLLGIKERQTQEDEKRAAQAGRISQLMGDLALDADKVLAEAAGDKNKVREIETEKAANELQRRFESEGMDPAAAAELAQKQAELQRLTGDLQNAERLQPQQGDAQRSIGLGGSAGLGPSIDVQKEIAKKQEAANSLLSEIKDLVKNRQMVRVAEVFD
jgi:hypothetical protein